MGANVPTFIEHLLCARHDPKCLAQNNSFNLGFLRIFKDMTNCWHSIARWGKTPDSRIIFTHRVCLLFSLYSMYECIENSPLHYTMEIMSMLLYCRTLCVFFFVLIFFDSSQMISHNIKSIICMLTRKQTIDTMVGECTVCSKRGPGKQAENMVNAGFWTESTESRWREKALGSHWRPVREAVMAWKLGVGGSLTKGRKS